MTQSSWSAHGKVRIQVAWHYGSCKDLLPTFAIFFIHFIFSIHIPDKEGNITLLHVHFIIYEACSETIETIAILPNGLNSIFNKVHIH